MRYKLRDADYFGAYNKIESSHQPQAMNAPLIFEDSPQDLSLVLLN
jgi:hypothetical protein